MFSQAFDYIFQWSVRHQQRGVLATGPWEYAWIFASLRGGHALGGRASLDEFTESELALLVQAEGGTAQTEWNGASMRWLGWQAFQLRDKWPETGCLRRIGDCLIEFAPNDAYVEDWRLQPSSPGPMIGLQLIEERVPATGKVTHRGGALVVCGDHAALVRGRRSLATGSIRMRGQLRSSRCCVCGLYNRLVHQSAPRRPDPSHQGRLRPGSRNATGAPESGSRRRGARAYLRHRYARAPTLFSSAPPMSVPIQPLGWPQRRKRCWRMPKVAHAISPSDRIVIALFVVVRQEGDAEANVHASLVRIRRLRSLSLHAEDGNPEEVGGQV